MYDSRFKGNHIKAEDDRKFARIFVFGQNEEVPSSNEAYPIISKPAGSSYKYIAASVHGDVGSVVIVLP